MGAAPSRETHARGIYPLLSNTTGAGRKPDIVLIPLTKEFFPSPDCPLFVQFHQARCDAAVNYYFRRPGNPGDLSRIPNYAHSYDVDDGRADRRDRRQRLRELLHLHRSQHQLQHPDEPITSLHAADEAEDELLRHEFSSGTAEEVDEDRRSCATDDDEDDWERYVYVRASGVDVSFPSREALYRGVIEKVEEALFDTDAEMREAYNWARAHPNSTVGPDGKRQRKVLPVLCAVAFRYDPVKVAAAAAAPAGSGANPFQAAMDSGVPLGNALVNIVGCFGFVSMEEEVSAAQNSFQHSLSRSSLHSYSSHGGSNFADLKRSDLITLPPPVAAPLAAMVFLTKSAGEQNLGRVTHMAATTYYFQMIESGVIQRNQGETHQPGHLPAAADSRLSPKTNDSASTTATTAAAAPTSAMEERPACSPPIPDFSLPPMETFSFSSLMTNIPILSFLYEMKWRWGYLGVLKASAAPTDDLPPRTASSGGEQSQTVLEKTPSLSGARHRDSTMGNHSSGGLAVVDRTTGQHVTDEMEMWITPDSMLHGRISKDLAERLCWSLAERPEVMQERVSQLPSEETGYWRYRGLVNRFHPPPLPSPTETDLIHPKDVYVMGSAVLPGFDEGDILRFDAEHGVWFADHSIPLEGVVLAAMRPYCKLAREAPSDDPGWVAKMVLDEDVELEQYITTAADSRGEALGLNGEPLPLPTAREEQAKLQRANPHLQLVHEHVGNFFIYQFQRDGATYYHGTVPHFSNPKKRPALSTSFARGASSATTPVIPFEPALGKTNEVLLPSLAVSPDEVSSPRSPVASSGTSQSTPAPKPQVAIPSSIASALFSLLPTVGVSMSSGTHGSGTDDPPQPTYLANRVKSTTLGAARRWMKSLYAYAQGSSLRNATTTTTVATPVMSSPSSSPQGRGATTDLLNPKRGVPPHVPNAADHQTYDGANLTVHIHQRTSSPASSTSTAAVSPCPLPRSRQPSFQVSEVVPNAVVGKPYASFPTATTAIYPMPQTHGGSNPSSPVAFSRRLSHHGGFLVMEDRSGEVVMSSPAEVVQQSEPVKRVVEGGAGYVWDWRQSMNLVVAHRGSPST